MDFRERFINTVIGKPVDRGVFAEEAYWDETIERWKQEGMPPDFDPGFDDYFCYPPVKSGFLPPFKEETVKDEGKTLLVRDMYGIIKRIKKNETGMPQFVAFPVDGRESWEELKKRLDPENHLRYPDEAGWQAFLSKAGEPGIAVRFGAFNHLSGFFGFLRELCGEKIYYLFYDDPELIEDMVAFQEYRYGKTCLNDFFMVVSALV